MTDIEFDLEALELRGTKSPNTSPILRTAFGKENRISLAPPVMTPFDPSAFALSEEEIGRYWSGDNQLVTISTALTFKPDFGCAFLASDFSIVFSLSDGGTPAVVDLSPRQVVRDESYQSQKELSAKIKGSVSPGLFKVLTVAGASGSVEVGGTRQTRDVWAFGLGGAEAGWRFQASLGHTVAGIFDDLRLAVCLPKGAGLRAQVRFAAEIAVENRLDNWATLAFGLGRTRSDPGSVFNIDLA